MHEGSNNTGTLRFRVTPDKGTATDIVVEIEDGEDVLVKKRKGPDYEVKFVESTLKGTRIDAERE